MKFASVGWLWLLAVLPFLYFIFSWDERRRKRQFALFAAQAVWASVAPEVDWGARLRKARYWTLAMAFAILAMARPQWGHHEEVVSVSGLDIMVVIDVSNSMEVEDVVPNRLKKAKHLVRSIAEKLRGDRMGAVAFAGSSFLASPLTTDLDYLTETVSILSTKMVVNQGTDVGIGLDTARKALERGAEEVHSGGSGESNSPASQTIILLSDGEDQENGAIEAASQLKQAGIKLFVVGIGTQKGGLIPIRDDTGNLQGYKRDKGQPVVSTFKPDALMQVAAAAGGRYWNATASEVEVDGILQEIGALNRSDYAERRYLVYEDRFQVPLFFAVLFMLISISTPARKLSVRERVNKGLMGSTVTPIGLLISALLGSAPSQEAHAASWTGKQPPLDVYIGNEKGLKAYREGKVDEAKMEFGAAQAKDPSLPELQFNRGVVQLGEGDLEGSIEAFSQAAQAAKTAPGGPDETLAGKSLFNLGAALSKKGDTPKAVDSYLGAIASAQASGDKSLEAEARKNIELLVQEEQQRKQKQKGESDKQNQEQKDSQDQQQSQRGKGNKDRQDQQQQAKQFKDEPRKKFKSEKLSPEDAERVMAELAGKERDLQRKMKKQHGNPSAGGQKDW